MKKTIRLFFLYMLIFATSIFATDQEEIKMHVQPGTIYVAPDAIYVNLDGILIAVNSIAVDNEGVYVTINPETIPPGKPIWCPKCRSYHLPGMCPWD
jgi:hypothetical protein